ncbi:hypothetical protein N665_0126s0059, partial [Sinapis alba]
SSWRILAFPTHYRTTYVEKLGFHLQDQEIVYYDEDEPIESVLRKKTINQSLFLAWFKANRKYPEARGLTYAGFPTKFVWKSGTREWVPRQRGFAIGRIAHIHPSCDELYFLRVLLNMVRGPTLYKDIKKVDGVLYSTYEEACYALGFGTYTRKLFARMLVSNCLSQPHVVWEATWEYLTEDILYKKRRETGRLDMNLTIKQIKNIALTEIENYLLSNGRSLKKWKLMPKPGDFGCYNDNHLINDELKYVVEYQLKENERLMAIITYEQRGVYNQILDAVLNDSSGVFFLYALSSAIRSRRLIVLNTASSGIAALLLEGGRTAHSRFGIPIYADEFSTCKKMKPGLDRAELVKAAKLIVWDEAPMMSIHYFETLDRSMRDIIRSSKDKPFGGKVVVFGGDFRQILLVIPGGGRSETVLATLNSSYLWEHCKVLKLTKNMRLFAGLTDDAAKELESFSKWILDIGDGKINLHDGQVEIDISSDLLIKNSGENPIQTITKEVYGESFRTSTNKDLYRHRAILTPTNDEVDKINDYMLSQLLGEEKVYLSFDSIIPYDFLNSVKVIGLPRHCLKLKVGAPIMCLCNMDVADGLCNGTSLIVTQLVPHVIQGRIITGNNIAREEIWIPRMFITPPDTKFPLGMRRRQFPVTLAFAMTINKS